MDQDKLLKAFFVEEIENRETYSCWNSSALYKPAQGKGLEFLQEGILRTLQQREKL